MKGEGWEESLRDVGQALERLGEALAADANKEPLAVDASLQRFEFSFEQFWKCLRRLIAAFEHRHVVSAKQTFDLAYQLEWITGHDQWIAMLDDRNFSSHNYSQEIIALIYRRLPSYLSHMKSEHAALRARFEGRNPHA